MTTFDAQGNRQMEPPIVALDGPQRVRRLEQLGLGAEPQPLTVLDDFARALAREFSAPNAMVNLMGTDGQYLPGLYSATGIEVRSVKGFETGMCPHVVARGKAFPLHNVGAFPRFAGNPVVDAMGVVGYLGTPLRLGPDEVILGTVCVVDGVERDWKAPDVERIKEFAAEAAKLIRERA